MEKITYRIDAKKIHGPFWGRFNEGDLPTMQREFDVAVQTYPDWEFRLVCVTVTEKEINHIPPNKR